MQSGFHNLDYSVKKISLQSTRSTEFARLPLMQFDHQSSIINWSINIGLINIGLNASLDSMHPRHLQTYQLQVDQLILGPSQRSVHDNAGLESRLRCSFISRYHRGSQGRPGNERCFNALQPFET
jgi:hypothetical protein